MVPTQQNRAAQLARTQHRFTIEIENRGPDALEIEFKQTRGDREVKVKGVCRAEGPIFAITQE